MRAWLIGVAVVLAALAGALWYFVLDGSTPARAEGEFQLEAYRALVENDAPETLPTDVRIELVGASTAPAFIAEAGAFGPARRFVFPSFQLVAPGGDTIIDGAVDAATLADMSDGEGGFDADAYARVLEAMTGAKHILYTHEHLDHVMAIARHPEPASIAPQLRASEAQLQGLPQHAPNGVLAPELAAISPVDLEAPQRIAPGVVAHAAPGHSPGTIVIYARTAGAREYLFIGDIAWVMSSIEHLRGRPRLIPVMMADVDPDRPRVLRQLRALHDMAAANPALVLVPAHDADYLNDLIGEGALIEGFRMPAAAPAQSAEQDP